MEGTRCHSEPLPITVFAAAAGDQTLTDRTRVLLTEALYGGLGLNRHANTNEELVVLAARGTAQRDRGRVSSADEEHPRSTVGAMRYVSRGATGGASAGSKAAENR